MNNHEINKNLDSLKEKDLYGILLYAIYKCTEDPGYSAISELIYTLDKESFFNLCSVFGGCTIKIPTTTELKMYLGALLIYYQVSMGKSFNEAYKDTDLDIKYKKDVIKIYSKLKDIIDNYGK